MPDTAIADTLSDTIARTLPAVAKVAVPHRISLDGIAEAARAIDPVFLNSPQFECETLSHWLKCELTLKVETLNPIRSFKGRGADYFLSRHSGRLARMNHVRLVCASAGNFGQALAYACRKRGLPLVVYAAVEANPQKVARMRALGAEVRFEGADFDAAKDAAKRWASSSGAVMIEDGLAPEITEGAGSIAVELCTPGRDYDAIFIPLGNGALLNGMGRWIKHVSPATRVIGVCSDKADAMQASWRKGPGAAVIKRTSCNTIADGIAVRVPIAEAVADMHGLVDDILTVDDAAILQSMRQVHTLAGLVVEPAGAAGIAALAVHAQRYEGQRVATVLCGSNLTATQMQDWLL